MDSQLFDKVMQEEWGTRLRVQISHGAEPRVKQLTYQLQHPRRLVSSLVKFEAGSAIPDRLANELASTRAADRPWCIKSAVPRVVATRVWGLDLTRTVG